MPLLCDQRPHPGHVHGEDEDDDEREVPGDQHGDGDEHVVVAPVAVAVEQRRRHAERGHDLHRQRTGRHSGEVGGRGAGQSSLALGRFRED